MQGHLSVGIRLLLAAGIVLFSYATGFCQISEGGRPRSFDLSIQPDIDEIELPNLNIDSILTVDAVEQSEGMPFRFGIAIPVDLNLENSGTWDTLQDGYLWRLRIRAQGARTININYDAFE